jgi:hypothetical protein
MMSSFSTLIVFEILFRAVVSSNEQKWVTFAKHRSSLSLKDESFAFQTESEVGRCVPIRGQHIRRLTS